MTDKSDILLDLDELAPPKVQVKFDGAVIDINPPSLKQYAKIIDFSEKLTTVKGQDGEFGNVADIYEELDGFIKELIPELAETKLNFSQLSSLFKLMSQIGAPTDKAIEKLREQGIEMKAESSDPKDSTSSDPLLNSSDTIQATEAQPES